MDDVRDGHCDGEQDKNEMRVLEEIIRRLLEEMRNRENSK